MLLKNLNKMFKKKYSIRYYNLMKNSPYNDAYFTLNNPNKLTKNNIEQIKIWTKEDKLKELIKKPRITKDEIMQSCTFPKQADELLIKLGYVLE